MRVKEILLQAWPNLETLVLHVDSASGELGDMLGVAHRYTAQLSSQDRRGIWDMVRQFLDRVQTCG